MKLNKGIFALNVHIKALFGILSIKKKKKAKRNLILVEKKRFRNWKNHLETEKKLEDEIKELKAQKE